MTTTVCAGCGNVIARGARGPAAVYCSARCRMRVYRLRIGEAPPAADLLSSRAAMGLVAAEFIAGAEKADELGIGLDAALTRALADLGAIDMTGAIRSLLDEALDHIQARQNRSGEWQKAIYAAEDATDDERRRNQLLELEQARVEETRRLSALHEKVLAFRGRIRDAIDHELRTAPPGQLGADRDQ